MTWSASQYLAFEAERTRPVRDLLAAVPTRPIASAVDLGCGPGNSTEILAERFPGARIIGLDSSPEMLAAARRRMPGVDFRAGTIEGWQDAGPFDVILANAVLQWVPDHTALLPWLAGRLVPGGNLAIQMPDNVEEPAHILMRVLAADRSWAAKLADAVRLRTPLGTPGWFYDQLSAFCSRVEIWRTTYFHRLAGGAEDVVEWFKGSALRPFLEPLDEEEREAFLTRYRAGIERAYPARTDGSVLLPFPRLFVVATR
jgi:trans-aconitate 2-methyltransferase